MKTRFTNFDSTRNRPDPVGTLAGSSLVTRHSSRREGFALVITLILLSVTLVMAIAFLAISRRERGSVTTTTDTATAQFAADAALASAEARITSQLLVTTNPYVFSLLVSTNYINQIGFTNGSGNLLNVNYNNQDAGDGGGPLTADMRNQNIANLYYSPRPPVFYGSNDFRFYLDLNRNGRYDTNGVVTNLDNNGNGLGTTSVQVGDPEWIGVLEHPDQPHGPNNPFIARYCFIAVPANSLDLNYIHNQVFDTPSSAATQPGTPSITVNPILEDAYYRDQGVGSWEMNLAAFLADLDTNRWGAVIGNPVNANENYYYYQYGSHNNQGAAFADARALIAWRYANNYDLLQAPDNPVAANNLFGYNGSIAFQNNGIDYYGSGQQMTFDTNYYDNPALPWAGAQNQDDFFSSPSELFNTNQTSAQFATNLVFAGVNSSTYDRYSFYRMLSQLGTDTQPAPSRLNINYQNAVVNYDFNTADEANYGPAITNVALSISTIPNMETNFVSWQPKDFFTAAANQLLKAYTTEWFESSPSNYFLTYYGLVTNYSNISAYGLTNFPVFGMTNQIPSFGITNIPVYVNGSFVYTPAVNRLLQLAANIYDSTTNTSTLINSNYPSVFRPIFGIISQYNSALNQNFPNVYIRGYQYVYQPLNNANAVLNGNIFIPPVEATDPSITNLAINGGISTSNVWGVPWIVGAKKGLPNFNGLEVDNMFFIERLLQFNRVNANPASATAAFPYGRGYTTNQMYIMGISNMFGFEDWNSAANNYNNKFEILAQETFSFGLSNDAPNAAPVTNVVSPNDFQNYQYNSPWLNRTYTSSAFILPLGTNTVNQPLSPSFVLNLPPSTNSLYVYYYGPNSVTVSNTWTFPGASFIPTSVDPSNFYDTGTPPLPHLVMQTTNRVWAYILDTADPNGPHIVDYVQLGGMNNSLDLNQAIADNSIINQVTQEGYGDGLWSTNYFAGNTPYGVYEQYLVSGNPSVLLNPPDGDGGAWATAPVPGAGNDNTPAAQAAYFGAFFSYDNEANYGSVILSNSELSIQAPYTPMRLVFQRNVYLANDPLVHYITPDLNDILDDTTNLINLATVQTNGFKYLNQQSDRYAPWNILGANWPSAGQLNYDSNPDNLSYKDPLVRSSDNWDFPTNKYPTVGWLGRVHRGTPWQTVFLKSTNLLGLTSSLNGTHYTGLNTWQLWTGNMYNSYDAENTAPDQDRLLFDLFTATPDDDATRGQLSVNIGADDPNNPLAGLSSWSALLSGTVAFSNSAPDLLFNFAANTEYQDPISSSQKSPLYSVWTVQPMGGSPYPNGSPTNTALWQIVQGINNTRTNFVAVDGLQGVFEHVGDILATPQLSDASPFLSSGDLTQQANGISDEMYEWLPQQIMGLLTVSGTPQNPPRYVVYCYGQSLKPAPNGIVETGSFAGMCTNYQVVSESAARAIIHVENAPTPGNPNTTPHVVVEQFNPLPPN